ncbi:hypothetical protein [uncultured Roseibium sp.]|uniref:hypothetical protein n=1 Tax=uncultured Roseibium sp. TaxID=1936171 RepID=UPI0026211842|nr:hypothetical protein [uncultured Roseibium sp.]
MSRKKVILLDQAQLGTILKFGGFKALDAIVARGDRFLYVHQSFTGDEDVNKISRDQRELFESWLEKKRYHGNKVLDAVRINLASSKEQKRYDPLRKAGTQGNNKELWDMGARKFMLDHAHEYDFEVISADQDFLDNRVGKHHPLKKVPFERLSMKSALSWLMTHLDVELSKAQFTELRADLFSGNYGKSHNLEQHVYDVPESYEAARRIREETRQAIQLEDRKKRKTNRKRAAGKARKLFGAGAPVIITAAAAAALHELITREADESGARYLESAQALGIDFTREQLADLAAEAGIDLAITLTPVGPIKKAWDVLGNIDDIIAVTQLYGAAYPENETIQQMAGIATAIEGSEAFGLYVDGRDALTGAVGGAIDWVFGTSEDEAELDERLGSVRTAIEEDAGTLVQAAGQGASTERLAGEIISRAEAHRAAIAAARPGGEVASGVTGPQTAAETGQQVLDDGAAVPREKPSGLGSDAVMAGPDGPVIEGDRAVPLAKPGAERRGLDAPVRKSSYDRYQRLGRSPEEEAEAVAEYWEMLRESYLEMDGHKEAAEEFAVWKFKQKWALSAFAPEAEGTVLKYPVETAYPDFEEDGHGYVRQEAEAILRDNGIRAARWYLTPNERTDRDKAQANEDEDGYGPRMTLSYEDETGQQHHVSDHFQANAGAARERRWQARYGAGRLQTSGKRDESGSSAAPESPRLENAPVPAPKPAFQTAQRPSQKPVPGPVSKPVREPLMPGVAKPRAKPDPAQL